MIIIRKWGFNFYFISSYKNFHKFMSFMSPTTLAFLHSSLNINIAPFMFHSRGKLKILAKRIRKILICIKFFFLERWWNVNYLFIKKPASFSSVYLASQLTLYYFSSFQQHALKSQGQKKMVWEFLTVWWKFLKIDTEIFNSVCDESESFGKENEKSIW